WTGFLMLGFSTGPLLGGAITHYAGWHAVFLLHVLIMLPAALMLWLYPGTDIRQARCSRSRCLTTEILRRVGAGVLPTVLTFDGPALFQHFRAGCRRTWLVRRRRRSFTCAALGRTVRVRARGATARCRHRPADSTDAGFGGPGIRLRGRL